MLENVAAIFLATRPDLPIPVTMTRPLIPESNSTARSKLLSRRSTSAATARASVSSTLRAVPSTAASDGTGCSD